MDTRTRIIRDVSNNSDCRMDNIEFSHVIRGAERGQKVGVDRAQAGSRRVQKGEVNFVPRYNYRASFSPPFFLFGSARHA